MFHNQLLVASILNLHIAASWLPDEACWRLPNVQWYLYCIQQYHLVLCTHTPEGVFHLVTITVVFELSCSKNPVVGVVTINLKPFFLCHCFQSGSTLYGLFCIV